MQTSDRGQGVGAVAEAEYADDDGVIAPQISGGEAVGIEQVDADTKLGQPIKHAVGTGIDIADFDMGYFDRRRLYGDLCRHDPITAANMGVDHGTDGMAGHWGAGNPVCSDYWDGETASARLGRRRYRFTGKCAGRVEPAAGATVQFALNLENMHLFDQASEQAI